METSDVIMGFLTVAFAMSLLMSIPISFEIGKWRKDRKKGYKKSTW